MKQDLIKIIKILGVDYKEILVDIQLDAIVINSLEIDNNNIIVHVFSGDMDIEFLYDDLSNKNKITIYQFLTSMLYN